MSNVEDNRARTITPLVTEQARCARSGSSTCWVARKRLMMARARATV